jgi:hypothetical protein
MRKAFEAVKEAHRHQGFSETRWATDQTHFYILMVSLIDDLKESKRLVPDLAEKLIRFDNVMRGLKGQGVARNVAAKIRDYAQLSEKQTTDAAKRQAREALFREIVGAL